MNENNSRLYMNSLACCLNRIVREGYTEDFRVTDAGLESVQSHYNYPPGEIQVINSFRFEGQSGPADNAVLYVIEATDGTKGTLVDSNIRSDDARLTRFIQNTETASRTVKN